MKWCNYCQKADHDDAECWCTRPADWPRGYSPELSLPLLPSLNQRSSLNWADIIGAVATRHYGAPPPVYARRP